MSGDFQAADRGEFYEEEEDHDGSELSSRVFSTAREDPWLGYEPVHRTAWKAARR